MNIKKGKPQPSVSFFNDLLTKSSFDGIDHSREDDYVPKVNILETNDDFQVDVAAPGMKKENFKIELDNDMLCIRGDIPAERGKDEYRYTCREFGYMSFSRSFYLPKTIEAENIEASYKNGILSLRILKKEDAKKKPAKTITIS